jgi:hypothetical protein
VPICVGARLADHVGQPVFERAFTATSALGHFIQVAGQTVPAVIISATVRAGLVPRSARPRTLVTDHSFMVAIEALRPVVVVPMPPPFMCEDRIVIRLPVAMVEPRGKTAVAIIVVVPVAEIVVVVPWTDKQVQRQKTHVNQRVRAITEARVEVMVREVDRGAKPPAVIERVIPIAAHEYVSARGIAIMIGHP